MDKRIFPPELHYNIHDEHKLDLATYERLYKEDHCLKILPYLVKTASLTPSSAVYDHGCGPAPLAFAFSNYLNDSGAYFGFDINLKAVTYLKEAYADRPNFRFHCASVPVEEDYVVLRDPKFGSATENRTAAKDIDLVSFVDRPIDVIYSGSVFTHMWPDTIVSTLEKFPQLIGQSGLTVSTWLIVDEFAEYVLKCGLADRQLPFEINGALTMTQVNPLVCTAYRESRVREIYARAGLEIVDIVRGSWAGRENGVTSQDIVVARALA